MTQIDEQIDNILLEHIVLATDNGQPYIKSTDTAVEAIKQLINQARIDELEKLLADGGQCICQLANQEACDHNWSLCNTVKDRIAQLRSTPND